MKCVETDVMEGTKKESTPEKSATFQLSQGRDRFRTRILLRKVFMCVRAFVPKLQDRVFRHALLHACMK
jgi:hypothetical protein